MMTYEGGSTEDAQQWLDFLGIIKDRRTLPWARSVVLSLGLGTQSVRPCAGRGVPSHEPARDDVRGRRRGGCAAVARLPGHREGQENPACRLALPDWLPGRRGAGRHDRGARERADVLGRRAALLLWRLPGRAAMRAGAAPGTHRH